MTPDNIYAELIETIEQKFQRRVTTPRDFDFLSNEIQRTVHANISVSTLKRLWGYVNTKSDYRPRMFTLDSLALLLGYQDYAAFLRHKDETASSDFIKNSHLFTSQLMPGDIITLKWLPDRIVEVKFLGQDMFAVTQSLNSKLDVGDTFSCGCFINNYPLYLNRLLHGDMAPTSYVCGKEGGIKYEIRRCNESNRGGDSTF